MARRAKKRLGRIDRCAVPEMSDVLVTSDMAASAWCRKFFEGKALEACETGVSAGMVAVRDRVFRKVDPNDETTPPSTMAGVRHKKKRRR